MMPSDFEKIAMYLNSMRMYFTIGYFHTRSQTEVPPFTFTAPLVIKKNFVTYSSSVLGIIKG